MEGLSGGGFARTGRAEVTRKDLRLNTPTVPSSSQVQQGVMAFTALLMLSMCLSTGSLRTFISTIMCGIYVTKLLHLQNAGSLPLLDVCSSWEQCSTVRSCLQTTCQAQVEWKGGVKS